MISIDSAGTHGYHVGHAPDSQGDWPPHQILESISAHLRARKVGASDFDDYDLMIAMDRSNFEDLQRIQPAGSKASLKMMMQYHPRSSA